MIPCIENRCLKLPICKSKESIMCTLLQVYAKSQEVSHESLWLDVNKIFPNAEVIYDDKGSLNFNDPM